MITREEILQEILDIKNKNILLELPTGFGKSKIAIERLKQLKVNKVLLVVNRIVHKQNWIDEFNKWWKDRTIDLTLTTYVSLAKHADNYDVIIYDEAHHLTDRCLEYLKGFKSKYNIFLSATVKDSLKNKLKQRFYPLCIYRKSLRNAIDNDILPDPKIYLIPLELNNGANTEKIIKNPKAEGQILETTYYQRWNFLKQKNHPVIIHCTEKQYLNDLNDQINWWKERYFRIKTDVAKNKWLRLCADRLKWLSDKKVDLIKSILKDLDKYRTLTFCNSIEQTEMLGKYCINSKNNKSTEYLNAFNNHKINHITACNILNESINLVDCQIGIYGNLNSSDVIIKQRSGRLLRHPKPVIIIPYYKNTREEELLNKMLENYNPKLINVINDYKNLKYEINDRPNNT